MGSPFTLPSGKELTQPKKRLKGLVTSWMAATRGYACTVAQTYVARGAREFSCKTRRPLTRHGGGSVEGEG
eukprot:1195793-Prorocentrum_minimum.AAC.4